MDHTPRPMKLAAGGRRDDALFRARRLTTRVGVGVLAFVGGLTIYLSHALPGHHRTTASNTSGTASTQPSAPATSAPTTTQPPSNQAASSPTSAPTTTVAPPTTVPVHVQRPAQISSGAS